jgi:hypothetical protein
MKGGPGRYDRFFRGARSCSGAAEYCHAGQRSMASSGHLGREDGLSRSTSFGHRTALESFQVAVFVMLLLRPLAGVCCVGL